MILQFYDSLGRPAADATVSVVESPEPFPDLGMIADELGQVSIEIPANGAYSFSIYLNGQAHRATAQLNKSDTKLSLRLT